LDIIDYEEGLSDGKVEFLDKDLSFYGELENRPIIEQELFSWQNKFYEATNKADKSKAWASMLDLCQRYSRSLVLKKVKGGDYVDPDIITDRATYAALAFMSQYLTRPGYHIGASFAGILQFKVKEALYRDTREDKHVSLNSILSVDGATELEELQEKVKFETLFGTYEDADSIVNNVSLKSVLNSLLREFDESVGGDVKNRILLRCWLTILLKKPKNKHAKKCFLSNWCDYKSKKLIDYATLELRRRLVEGATAL
jgi:hypothetical protein